MAGVRIGIDIDSTLFHYWDGFAAAAHKRFGLRLPYEQQVTWDIPELRPEQARAVVQETHRDENILAGKPYPGAIETVRAWHDAGHWIHVTSHRAETCDRATRQWLATIALPFDDLHCSFDKVSRCVELGIDLLVDDSPVNLEAALDRGIRVATILHPWNRELCETEDVVCADDWPGLARALEPVLGVTAP